MHTRAIVRVKRDKEWFFWEYTEDFGIPYNPDDKKARHHPKVVEAVQRLKKRYIPASVVHVSLIDC